MSAPIGHTCPNIDSIVRKLEQQIKWVRKFNDHEDKKAVEDLFDECESIMNDAIDTFEDLRKDNDTLRKWGIEMEQEAESLSVQLNETNNYETV